MEAKITDAALGIDIGGSAIKAGLVDTGNGHITNEPVTLGLRESNTPSALLKLIESLAKDWGWRGPVGVGFPGVVVGGRTATGPHLHSDWSDHNFLNDLARLDFSRAALLNDADAAGLAEMEFGAGRKRNGPGGGSVLMLTLGTGIGSALFHNGNLFPNTELGHIELDGADAEKTAAAAEKISQKLDWPEWGSRVNRYLAEMEKLINPDLIIIGGGVSENFGRFRPFLSTRCDVVPAALGNRAGLVGAALCAVRPDLLA